MKKINKDFFPDDDQRFRVPASGSDDDADIAAQLKIKIGQFLRLCLFREAEVNGLVEHAFAILAAVRTCTLQSARTEHLRRAQVCTERGKHLDEQLRNGRIPEYSADVFAVPDTAWAKFGFWALAVFAVLPALLDLPNFAWYLRFWTDSFWFGLVCALPIISLPFLESAVLHKKNLFTERTKNVVLKVQAVLCLAAVVTYVYVCLRRAEGSDLLLARQECGLSQDSIRMGLQLLSSLLASGVFLQCAYEMGVGHTVKNPRYAEAVARIEAYHREASQNYDSAGKISGELERLESIKQEGILSARLKIIRIRTEEDRHNEIMRGIIDEEL